MAQRVHRGIEIQAPMGDVFWYRSNFENFENFENFPQNVEEVRMTG